jgi:peptidoglycan/xylan/chitin deacetylase (PgdA/CDA1 family)
MKTIFKCFPDGKYKALTMSYDDGRKFDKRLIDIFNKYGIKGTFHLNSGFLGSDEHVDKSEMRELYKNHEVATHTVTHPTIARCPKEQIVQQILKDRENLEEIMEYTVRGLSYPNGSYNSEIVNMLNCLGIEYSRVVGSKDSFNLPDDFYTWQATCHHNHNVMKHAETFVGLFKKQYLYLMYVWGHSYEFDRDNNWELIEEFCSYVSNKDDVWYATNIEIVDYIKLLNSLKFSVKGNLVYNPSAKSAWISVDGEIIEIKGGVQQRLF